MSVNNNLSIPPELRKAQIDGKLVIFAGAGVSMARPSNLPSFKQLAILIGEGKSKPKKNQPFDHYLGELAADNVDIGGLAREIINKERSKPNNLHKDLLRLFRIPDNLRIITTNFDLHFSTAAQELFGCNPRTYYAPALPLGKKFSGLVYLHGALNPSSGPWVLCDKDFGEAYIVDGWASRFLVDVFSNNVVLFVGYSHSDPIMHYLGRALPITSQRFVFACGDFPKWKYLGITPISYEMGKRHFPLLLMVSEWAKRTTMTPLAHQDEMRRILKAYSNASLQNKFSITLPARELAYMNEAFQDVSRTRYFVETAESVNWLSWAKEQPEFKALYKSEKLSECSSLLADWFAEKFVITGSPDALEIIQPYQHSLNFDFLACIACKLAHSIEGNNDRAYELWVPILVSNDCREYTSLLSLLGKLNPLTQNSTAILLFEYLLRPILHIKAESAFITGNEEDFENQAPASEIKYNFNHHLLMSVWKKKFLQNLDVYWRDIIQILSHQILLRRKLRQSYEPPDRNYDYESIFRTTIEEHEQNRYARSPFFIIIDILRDTILWLVQNQPSEVGSIVNSWIIEDDIILKRLAIFALTERRDIDSDEKICLLVDCDLIHNDNLRHEVFRLIKENYPRATISVRNKLITEILAGCNRIDSEDKWKEECKFIWLDWLKQSAPGCTLPDEHIDRIKEKYPDLKATKHPDIGGYVEAKWYVPQSPISFDELIQEDMDRLLELLQYYQGGDRFSGPSREGLLVSLSQVIQRESVKLPPFFGQWLSKDLAA